MKKILSTILSSAALSILIVAPAFAATIVSVVPQEIKTEAGKDFSLTISMDPQNAANYSGKIKLSFPADLMEAKAFNFGSGWTAVNQPGYDIINNKNGIIIKTAGYPGGITAKTVYGSVLFSAKKSGEGIIKLEPANSLALNNQGQNTLSNAITQTKISVSAAALKPTATTPTPKTVTAPTVEPIIETSPATQEQAPSAQAPISVTPTEIPSAPQQNRSTLAALGSVLTLGTGSIALGILVFAIIVLLVGWAVSYVAKNKSKGGFLGTKS